MTQKSDRKKISAGLKRIGIAVPLMFLGPIVVGSAFKNTQHEYYYPVLAIGIIICLCSMFLFFKGLQKMVSGFFNDTKQ